MWACVIVLLNSVSLLSQAETLVLWIASPCLVYWRYCNPTLRSHGTMIRMVPHKVSDLFEEIIVCCLFTLGNKRMDETHQLISLHNHTWHVYWENQRNHWKWNGFYSQRTTSHHSNMISVKQLESKNSILMELDMKIAECTTDPDELEN